MVVHGIGQNRFFLMVVESVSRSITSYFQAPVHPSIPSDTVLSTCMN